MKFKMSLVVILFLSFSFGVAVDGKLFELSLGKIKSSNNATLSNFQNEISVNFKLKHDLENNLYSNCFIEYNKFNHDAIPAEYEMYLVGLGIEKHFNIIENLKIRLGSSIGLSDDQYTLDWEVLSNNEFITGNFNNADFTFDDIYLFLRLQLGSSYAITDKVSMFLDYKVTFTNEQYGVSSTDWNSNDDWTFEMEDVDNIVYDSFNIGINYKLF